MDMTRGELAPRTRRPGLSVAQDCALVLLYALFCWVYVRQLADGRLTALPFAVEQGLLVVIFLTRRRSAATSTRPVDWLFATIGGFLPLALRPTDGSSEAFALAGTAAQAVGLTLTCVGFLYLGRSFGVVAANRGLKDHGPYRLVRHPIYLSHTITLCGFLLANFGAVNLLLIAVTLVAQVFRMSAEERVLTDSASYADYRARVRWRLFPGLY